MLACTRVSSHDEESGLDGQVARLSAWAAEAGLPVVRVEAEVGSGMNGSRAKVRRLLSDPVVTVVVVEHRDRLGRMNTELVEAALAAHQRHLVVLEDSEVTDDLVGDMVEVLAERRSTAAARHQTGRPNIGPKAVQDQATQDRSGPPTRQDSLLTR